MRDTTEDAFLRAMLADPGDEAVRLVYADWLDDHGDPRGPFLRDDTTETPADPGWLAFLETLARPFVPAVFWRVDFEGSIDPPCRPFREPVGTRGGVVTFESAFRGDTTDLDGLTDDLAFLTGTDFGECYYGSGSYPIRPFLAELAGDGPLTGTSVLAALKVDRFRSQHTTTLEATDIPAPGYHPGTLNDEAHTDPNDQNLFWHNDDGHAEDDADYAVSSRERHAALRGRVADGRLWYVLLHTWFTWSEGGGRPKGAYVVLFAVGRSRLGRRLVGVVSRQGCRNLCD